METTYYTLTAREILVEGAEVQQACGGSGRRLVCVRKAPEARQAGPAGKVIDLAAWRADREPVDEAGPDWETESEAAWAGPEQGAVVAPRRARARRSRSALGLEIVASLSVTAVALVLLVQAIGMF